jgi:phosphatidylglycerophosphate synthase
MIDTRVRALTARPLDATAGLLARTSLRPAGITAAGWLAGIGGCLAAGERHWLLALALWLTNRALDGLDGPLARRRGATGLGGYLDIVADFSVYAGFVVAVAVAVPEARLACVALLAAYYVSGTAFLALSSMAERRRAQLGDNRSLRFVGGLAEGFETIAVYTAICLAPQATTVIVWAFTAAVAVTAGQRVWWAARLLRPTATNLRHPAPVPAVMTGFPEAP